MIDNDKKLRGRNVRTASLNQIRDLPLDFYYVVFVMILFQMGVRGIRRGFVLLSSNILEHLILEIFFAAYVYQAEQARLWVL
jgi:hypothetical protein